ncbi:hypothetical protein [Pseudomonas phage vB_PseuGesM_254]|uniref:Uncharacterized protein n=1 Tax=Pseudomonas phage vB_PseuGesM_254 TaxID=3092638 RepID=A0AAX4G6Q1_9CAUD|nr:hypothetical protein [Pseudomonas phage PseuGes_254]
MQFVQKTSTNYKGTEFNYTVIKFEEDTTMQEQLAKLAEWLSHSDGTEDLFDLVRQTAAEIAEDAEMPFVYDDIDGNRQEYTPVSLWEASNCEWEQSAQQGYDYGWNI